MAEPAARMRAAPLRAAAIGVAVGLVLADSSIAVLALPAIFRELDVELDHLHWALTSFNLALAVAAAPVALLARRVAARGTFAGGLVLFAAASAACALAPDFWSLVGFRAAQALGGAAVVVAALPLLAACSERERAVTLWVAAGTAGAALGPALGGALTEAISWRAVFAFQAPAALLPLPFLAGIAAVPPAAARTRLHLAANLALGLISAGLAAALFLVVLLLIEGWGLSPIGAAAVVTVLPLAAVATAPFARRIASPRAAAAAGVLLTAGGLTALGLLPGAHWGWTLPPQVLLGAGLALAFAGLTDLALHRSEPQAVHAGVTVAARHAGIVAGLLLLTPVLVDELDRQEEAAEQAGAAHLLDAQVSPATKLRLAQALSKRLEGDAQTIPDFAPAFREVEPAPDERAAVAALQRQIDDTVDRAVTAAFSPAFLVAAALALAALLGLPFRRRGP
jgi:MFS family permease